MNPTDLSQLAAWAHGRLRPADGDAAAAGAVRVSEVSTDSRQLAAGELFVALRGDRFDGHAYLAEAAAAGCAAALVEVGTPAVPGLAFIEVRDTLEGLQQLAAGYRRTLTSPVIGVTGSSGKTSTKELLRAALSPLGKVQATVGNLNNHIGLPLSVLRGDDTDAAHIWELGMNHPGEIAPLAGIAAPQAGVITMIGTAHIEFMGSREAIAREKGELLQALPESGLAILPAGDDFVELLAELSPCRVIRAGFPESADYRVVDFHAHPDGSSFVLATPQGEIAVRLPAPGRHMAANAALAVAAAVEVLGLAPAEVAAALGEARLVGGRLSLRELGGLRILDDSYNANPESTAAALRTLAELPSSSTQPVLRRVAVLGQMGELGPHELPAYQRLADLAAELEIAVLHVVGPRWQEALASSRHPFELHLHPDTTRCVDALRCGGREGDLVLVKGSRAAAMERVVEGLTQG